MLSVLSLVFAFIVYPRGPINVHHVPRRDKDQSSDWLKFSPPGFWLARGFNFFQWTGCGSCSVAVCVQRLFVYYFHVHCDCCVDLAWPPYPLFCITKKNCFPMCFSVHFSKCTMCLKVAIGCTQFCVLSCGSSACAAVFFVCWSPLIACTFAFELLWVLANLLLCFCCFFPCLSMFFEVCFVCNFLLVWFAVSLLAMYPRLCLFCCRYLLSLSLLWFNWLMLIFCWFYQLFLAFG